MSADTARPAGQDGSHHGQAQGDPLSAEILAGLHAALQRKCQSKVFAVGPHLPEIVFPYVDADRNPVAAMARFAPGTLEANRKSYRAFSRTSVGWQSGVKPETVPLYRFAELLSVLLGGGTVYVPEGEKCVDALYAVGIPATTNAFGAGKWQPHHTETLRGAHVALLYDNDEPGRTHARSVAKALVGVAASVRILDLPGVDDRPDDDGWDVADWLAEGGDAESLSLLTEVAEPLTPEFDAEEGPAADPQAGQAHEGWTTPLPLGVSSEAEEFPIETALTPTLIEICKAYAESVRVDVSAPAVVVPAILSIAAGNAFSVRVSLAYAEPNLSRYVIWIKPSGERGSEMMRRLLRPLDAWMDAQAEPYEKALKQAKAAEVFQRKLAEKLEAKAARAKSSKELDDLRKKAEEARLRIPALPPRPLLYLGDVTSEATVRSMYEQGGSFGICSADARQTVDEVLGRYRSDGKTNDNVYLRAHGGDVIDRGRIGNVPGGEYIRIPHPALGLALCVQPDKFTEMAERGELFGSGFFGRLNLVQPRSLIGTRLETGDELPMDPALVDLWNQIVQAVITARHELMAASGSNDWAAIEISLDAEAMEARRLFFNEIETRQGPKGDLRDVTSIASKCAGEAARLAALMHLAELGSTQQLSKVAEIPIPIAVWNVAEAHQRWLIAESLRLLSLWKEDASTKKARRVLAWCTRESDARRTVTAHDVIGARIVDNGEEFMWLMSWLAERGWVRKRDPQKGQRAERWEVHPIVFEEEGQ